MPSLNWYQFINFWCHFINIWGHALLTTCFTGEGLAVNWRWTWLNYITSILVNRVLFLLDIGKYHLHAWIVNETEVSESYQSFWHIEFYLNTLLIGMHLALFQYSAFDFGVLLPETPEEAHVFQDGHVQPLLEAPMPTLTRLLFIIGLFYWFDQKALYMKILI